MPWSKFSKDSKKRLMDETQSYSEPERFNGPERRRDNLQLDAALAEVQRLHNAATTLANAVANTAHRSELVALQDEVKREFQIKLVAQAVLTVVALCILIFYMQFKFNHLTKQIDKGHDVVLCMQSLTEAQRTGDLAAQSLLTCEQSSR